MRFGQTGTNEQSVLRRTRFGRDAWPFGQRAPRDPDVRGTCAPPSIRTGESELTTVPVVIAGSACFIPPLVLSTLVMGVTQTTGIPRAPRAT